MEIVLKSLFAAVVTGIILIIVELVGPRMAGAIGGLPIIFAVSYVFVTTDNRSVSNDFLMGGIYGALAAIFFSIVLILLNNKLPDYYWGNFVLAYLLCFLFAFVIVHFTNK